MRGLFAAVRGERVECCPRWRLALPRAGGAVGGTLQPWPTQVPADAWPRALLRLRPDVLVVTRGAIAPGALAGLCCPVLLVG